MTTDARTAASSQPPAASRQPPAHHHHHHHDGQAASQPASERGADGQQTDDAMRCDATRCDAMPARDPRRTSADPDADADARTGAGAGTGTGAGAGADAERDVLPQRPEPLPIAADGHPRPLSLSLSLSHSVLLRQSSPASRRIRSAPPVGRRPASPDYHPNLVHGAALPCDALGDAAQGRGALQAAARSLEGTALLGGGELVELSVVGLHVIQVCAQKPVSCRRFGVHGPCGGREEQW
ncbi:uncharacterized protein SETTUDRAFT_178298 [Exserohilum turcica Et28A]|uniref:Uncharacterized protein n=1 Tax=Exserohilum turcicum (strain 28A) TaxID=671987 RepID=R0J4T7_EXST2|nr:uncharacterized protein SETTUDRAFT_178298 [Exserohilum turcica Et28A]EOA91945.1 hypothetical protein SETTUDRAFT_178298 [Exserohilum turcica Et28A]